MPSSATDSIRLSEAKESKHEALLVACLLRRLWRWEQTPFRSMRMFKLDDFELHAI